MRAFTLFALVVLATTALADAFDNQIASVQLLQTKAVQKELAISEAQRSKMNVFAQEFNKQAEAYRNELNKKSNNGKIQVTPDRNREIAMLNQLKTKVLGTLSAGQVKRLREISLQAVGVTALGDDAVAQKIGLSETQKKQIRDLVGKGLTGANKLIQDANQRAMKGIAQPKNEAEAKKAQELFQKRSVAEQQKIKGQVEKIRSTTITGVMAILNAKQKSTWNTLLGKPFIG
jgi:hypothetical protein